MSVLTGKALHEQLSVIMGALAKAAVVEICGVVDEGFAVLQMEIMRSHKENEDLKKKLHLIESIVVRSGKGTEAAAVEAPQRQDSDGGAGATVEVQQELPDVVLIKDDDSDSADSSEEDKKRAAARGDVSQSAKRRWRGSEAGDRKLSNVTAGTTKRAVSVYTLDSPRSEPGCSSQLGDDEMEACESVCSFSSQVDPDIQLVHQECPPLPPSASRQAAYFGNGARMDSRSPLNRAELDLSLTWTQQSKSQVAITQFHQNENLDGDAFGIKLISVSGSASTDCQLSQSSNSALEYENADVTSFSLHREQPSASGRGTRFVCSVCSRTYATSQNLDVHMRIHTGERPFSCDHCGKKFTQSAHLKSHVSVHTGERPYVCTICSRSFIVKYSLKLHMRKCHPNVLSQ